MRWWAKRWPCFTAPYAELSTTGIKEISCCRPSFQCTLVDFPLTPILGSGLTTQTGLVERRHATRLAKICRIIEKPASACESAGVALISCSFLRSLNPGGTWIHRSRLNSSAESDFYSRLSRASLQRFDWCGSTLGGGRDFNRGEVGEGVLKPVSKQPVLLHTKLEMFGHARIVGTDAWETQVVVQHCF